MPLNIAIVGCGKIADGHAEEIQKIPSVRLAAVCDREPLMAEQLALRFGIPKHYGDFDEMLRSEQMDVVHITTPPQSHVQLTEKAVQAGCHVFVEKPLAMTCPEARHLIDIVARGGRKMSINYWPNFEPPAVELRRLIEAGVIGEPVHVESYCGYNLSGKYGEAILRDSRHWVHQLPGKLFQNIFDHVLFKITPFLTDEDPEMHTMGYRRRPAQGESSDAMLDELRVMIRGEKVSAYATFCSHARPLANFVRVYGTKQTVYADWNNRIVVLEPDQTLPSAIGRLAPAYIQARRHLRQANHNLATFAKSQFHFFAGLNRLLTLFYDSIRNGTPVPISYDEMLRISAWMDRIFAAVYPPEAA